MVLDTHATKLLVHAIDFGYSKAIAVNRVRLHRDVVVECCCELGKDFVSKHIWRCFQLVCDLLRALEDVGVQDRYKSRWFCQHDAQKQHASLDARYAVASTKAREKKSQIIVALDPHLSFFFWRKSQWIPSCTSTYLLTLTTSTYHSTYSRVGISRSEVI